MFVGLGAPNRPFFDMRPGQNRAAGVMKHLCRVRPQQKPPVGPMAVSRHNDQVDFSVPSDLAYGFGRIAAQHHDFRVLLGSEAANEILELLGAIGLGLGGSWPLRTGMVVHPKGSVFFGWRGNYVEKQQLGASPAGNCRGVLNRPAGSLREVHRYENRIDFLHRSLLQ